MSRRRDLEKRLDEHDQAPDGPRRRREDTLEELVEELHRLRERGSENFRRYRRRAMAAFGLLMAATVVEGYLIVHNARAARDELARSGIIVALRACHSENELRASMRGFVVAVAGQDTAAAAAHAFPARNCLAQASPLRVRLRRP